MPVFTRRSEPPTMRRDYTIYRREVREDFVECCAYCLLPELLAGGQENFELDHFHPTSKADRLDGDVNDFYNLYYSCHVCNHLKSSAWPSTELLACGCRFIDLCNEEFGTHFQPGADGRWNPITPAARWADERLRLNRSHLIEIRGLLNQIANLLGREQIDWARPARDQIALLLPKDLVRTTSEGL